MKCTECDRKMQDEWAFLARHRKCECGNYEEWNWLPLLAAVAVLAVLPWVVAPLFG